MGVRRSKDPRGRPKVSVAAGCPKNCYEILKVEGVKRWGSPDTYVSTTKLQTQGGDGI